MPKINIKMSGRKQPPPTAPAHPNFDHGCFFSPALGLESFVGVIK
jgi:hypothetical protein